MGRAPILGNERVSRRSLAFRTNKGLFLDVQAPLTLISRTTRELFPRFQLLDAAGPMAAFESANRYRPGTYEGRPDADRIFTRDGKFWTFGGVTAGIDLALVLIEEDLGEPTAKRVAQQLVVYHRRPGGQSQFSALLEMENPQGRFASLLEYLLPDRCPQARVCAVCSLSLASIQRLMRTASAVRV
jgi:transcriptional regulator GlxA family with amidase domain